MKSFYYFFITLFLLSFNSTQAQLNDPNFFPTAVWLQSTFRAQAYKDAGMNMYIGLWNKLNQAQLTDLNNAGMYVITRQDSFGLAHINDTIIAAWKQDKSEPDNAQWNSSTQSFDPCVPPATMLSRYNVIKTNDPSRKVMIGLGRGVSALNWIGRGTCTGNYQMYKEQTNGYIAAGDFVSFDIYPINDADTATSEKLWYVPKGIDSLRAWATTPKTFFAWIETTKFDAVSNRAPTPAEVKSEVWMAVIHGANGIGYFCHRLTPNFDEAALLHDVVMIDSVESINRRLHALAPVLNSATTVAAATVSSSNAAVPIDIMTKSYQNEDYIFAVAMRPGATVGTFSVPVGSSIEVIGESRTLTESGGQFTDPFAADYAVHLYKVLSPALAIDPADEFHNISIFPNPTSGKINIDIPQNSKSLNISICNSLGEIVFLSTENKTIDLSEQVSGIYFVSVRVGGRLFTRKVMLRR